MNEYLLLKSHKVSVKIKGKTKLLKEISDDPFTKHIIPDVEIMSKGYADLKFIQDDKLERLVDINYPIGRFKSNLSPRDIVTLGEYFLERGRQEKNGEYALSSSTACKNGKAVTFWGGATHLGKTSSMLALIKNLDYEFVSDEKTLINLEKKIVSGGSRSIPTRKDVIRDKVGANRNNDFHQLNISKEPQESALFIYPHLDHGLKKPIFYRFKDIDFYWLLTRELSVIIRGSVRLVNNFTYQVESIDTPELSDLRVKKTKKFTEEVPCYYFQGSIEQMTNFIDNTIKNKE